MHFDAIVVGGGPAGSSCARRLVAGGARVLVLDREVFPRLKLCAGWITPEVVADLELNPEEYPHRFNTFDEIIAHVKGFTFRLRSPQHSIRRFEFDDYLLNSSGAEVVTHNVRHIERAEDGRYVIDDTYSCDYLIGAGGTRCPVYRTVFRQANPRARELQAVTCEHEFPYQWGDPRCHLWFFDRGLPGYAWYVPKADGYINCGLGGMAMKMKARGQDIKHHWHHFTEMLKRKGFVTDLDYQPGGYSYYLRGDVDVVRIGNAFITGDAAGLATRDLCEGIGPAVRSGQRAARSVLEGEDYRLDDLAAYSVGSAPVRKLLDYLIAGRAGRPVSRPGP